jgi:hypothetical protein
MLLDVAVTYKRAGFGRMCYPRSVFDSEGSAVSAAFFYFCSCGWQHYTFQERQQRSTNNTVRSQSTVSLPFKKLRVFLFCRQGTIILVEFRCFSIAFHFTFDHLGNDTSVCPRNVLSSAIHVSTFYCDRALLGYELTTTLPSDNIQTSA